MEIKIASETDIPEIVDLLKVSLGEGLMPKSEQYWRWKHIENPFGKSPVLLAREDGKLVGVRAFMRWQWTDGKEIYKAVRAVDTATHPDFQGKGIFKKLTLGLVDSCKEEGVHFVFNTPNTQSRPGYLKMQWHDAGRLPIRFRVVNPLHKFFARPVLFKPFKHWFVEDRVKLSLQDQVTEHTKLHTRYSEDYLLWRYGTVPVAEYFVFNDENNTIIYRLKKNSWGTELRITDWFNLRDDKKSGYKKIQLLASQLNARVVTVSGIYPIINGGIVLNKGPQVTVRNLNFEHLEQLYQFANWSPTLGDMELF